MDLYEITDDERDLLQLKDTYEEFEVGDVYINMSKKDKRTYTKNYFTEKIQNMLIIVVYLLIVMRNQNYKELLQMQMRGEF